MEDEIFYDVFHKKTNIQRRVVNDKNFTYRLATSIIQKQISRKLKELNKNLEMLDYGCGSGTLSFYFAKKGIKVTGVDISGRAIQLATKSAKSIAIEDNTNFFNLDVGLIKLRNKRFEIVLCLEVIEHVRKDKELIRFLVNKLKKNGILIISTPSIDAPLNRMGITGSFDSKVGHIRRYSCEELVVYVESLPGVKSVESIVTEGILRNSLFIFPFLGTLIRFIRGPISDIVTYLDGVLVRIFGGSNVFIIVQKL